MELRWRRWQLWVAIALVAVVLLPGTGLILRLTYLTLHRTLGVAVDLATIGLAVFLVAALLAPLEALGWWAGWYGDEVQAKQSVGGLAAPVDDGPISRFVVYLDGIGQASYDALPEGEDFLQRLADALPDDMAIVRGIMPYSVLNRPITESPWLAGFWRWADRLRLQNPKHLLGLAINLRNVTVVTVAADQRYGPIYNQGTAQVIYDSLIANGYCLGSSTPVTLLGFSGGGQISLGALPYLKRTLGASIEVISLGGVFSGNHQFLEAEHIYHLVGDRDSVERLGPIAFPRRWKIIFLSYWNRAKRRGKISFISLGPVGHELPGGILDAEAQLPDGRSHMQQTVERVAEILRGERAPSPLPRQQLNNYERYQTNGWHQLDWARDTQALPNDQFRPLAAWLGRLILPELSQRPAGVQFEVFHAPPAWAHLVGQRLRLRWQEPLSMAVAMDVHFSGEALYSWRQGIVHPTRLQGWRQVTPLESLAGARPRDDQFVALLEPVVAAAGDRPTLTIAREPVQTTGMALALVQFQEFLGGDRWQAQHFDPQARAFVGPTVTLRLPEPVANSEGILPATARKIHQVPLNVTGWYVSGVPDGAGAFTVQSLAPRALLRLQPEQVITGQRAAWRYVKRTAWQQTTPGTISSVLVSERRLSPDALLAEWQVGDRLLVLHVYGGIGGEQREKAAQAGLFFGHFAYGVAEIVREPLADELSLAIRYQQVYAHNVDGIIAGTQSWWRYLGDRQIGWLGTRPVADILVRFPPFTGSYTVGEVERSPLTAFGRQLEAMTARYRVGDGTGATYVGPANNCAQDSNQALYDAIQQILAGVQAIDSAGLRVWEERYPEQAERLQALLRLEGSLRQQLLPLGNPRADWQVKNDYMLGISLEDRPLRNLARGLLSWRTMFPRLASDTVVKVFLAHGASALVLRTNQVGGDHPEIEPVVPMTL